LTGANRCEAAELKAERAAETACREAEWQSRIVDPEMDALREAAVAGERKVATSIQPQARVSCGEL